MTYLPLGMGLVIGGMLPIDVGPFEYLATIALATVTPSAAGTVLGADTAVGATTTAAVARAAQVATNAVRVALRIGCSVIVDCSATCRALRTIVNARTTIMRIIRILMTNFLSRHLDLAMVDQSGCGSVLVAWIGRIRTPDRGGPVPLGPAQNTLPNGSCSSGRSRAAPWSG